MASVDTPEDNKAFAEKESADFPMLSDPERKVADAYGVLPPPNPARPDAPRLARRWMFFIGPDGKILHIEKANHTADAGTFLAAKLEELGVKKK
jgi:peroxiredoxin Q/BCP